MCLNVEWWPDFVHVHGTGKHQGGSYAPFLDVASNPSTRSDITVGGLLNVRNWHSPRIAQVVI